MRAADGCFLSALQPNSSRTSYGVPSDMQISDGPYGGDAAGTRARRVQEQVRMRLAEKKCSSIPRLNGSTGEERFNFSNSDKSSDIIMMFILGRYGFWSSTRHTRLCSGSFIRITVVSTH